MTIALPGGGTLAIGGMDKRTHGALPLVPVMLTLGSSYAINLVAGWLCDKLKRANVQHILIEGVEIEVTLEEITEAISESISESIQQVMKATIVPEEQIVSGGDAIICLRVPPDVDVEQYVQGSTIQKCSLCDCDVLVAPSSQMILVQGQNQIVCMECWTQAHPPEFSPEEREGKLRKLREHKAAGEQAYDDMYEKAHSLSEASAFYSEAKESFHAAIGLARDLGLDQEIEELQTRLAHIKSIFRSQFS
ncbi:MAG TPA: hypothetical protein VKZ53_25890 [Candidatus Angelobacter sp.]|nr:hypothetical protein [Candidatus Angelobacter sp.]